MLLFLPKASPIGDRTTPSSLLPSWRRAPPPSLLLPKATPIGRTRAASAASFPPGARDRAPRQWRRRRVRSQPLRHRPIPPGAGLPYPAPPVRPALHSIGRRPSLTRRADGRPVAARRPARQHRTSPTACPIPPVPEAPAPARLLLSSSVSVSSVLFSLKWFRDLCN
jgi:hypothetical protein